MNHQSSEPGGQHAHHHGHTGYPRQIDHDLRPHRPTREQLAHIQGWGADLDRKDWPAMPMERTPPRFIHVPEGQPVQQEQTVEVFVSPERPGITPVFGTAQPPKGLSGLIRKFAYKLPENDIRHFLLLMFADRVNVVEGIAEDLSHGKVPNVLGEMGIKSEMKHNPQGLAVKAVAVTAIAGAAWYLLQRRRSR